jgi:single-strand binding protein|nr:MAG TPA: Single strand binding protein [Caudoviricetes sp.]
MNKVVLIGRLVRDPDVRYTQSGKAVTSFTLAADRRVRKDADAQQTADFIPVVAWDKLAEICGNYLAKGRRTAVEGHIQVRSYEAQDGSKRYVTEVVAENVEFLETKRAATSDASQGYDGVGGLETPIPDDDIPF